MAERKLVDKKGIISQISTIVEDHSVHIRYGLLITSIITGFGIREAHRIAPTFKSDVSQIAALNKLENVNIHGNIGGCVPVYLKGSL